MDIGWLGMKVAMTSFVMAIPLLLLVTRKTHKIIQYLAFVMLGVLASVGFVGFIVFIWMYE